MNAIADNMFRFWYRFIPDNNSIISRGATELAYKRIAPNLSDYMGRIFEENMYAVSVEIAA